MKTNWYKQKANGLFNVRMDIEEIRTGDSRRKRFIAAMALAAQACVSAVEAVRAIQALSLPKFPPGGRDGFPARILTTEETQKECYPKYRRDLSEYLGSDRPLADRPPLGVVPAWLNPEQSINSRISEIQEAIARRVGTDFEIPERWEDELRLHWDMKNLTR